MAEQDTTIINKAVEDFLRQAKNLRTKQDFLLRMAEYEKRFSVSNANLDKSVTYSQGKHGTGYSQPLPNPFLQGDEDKRRPQNPFKTADRKNYHKGPPSYHSRTQMDFYKPSEQQIGRINLPSELNRFERSQTSANLVGRNYVDPELQELLIQQQMHNAKLTHDRQSSQQQFYPEPNEFLRQYEEQPDYVKFYRRQIPPSAPPSPLPKVQNQIQPGMGQYYGQNPFQKR